MAGRPIKDRTLHYAKKVMSGEMVAGPHVRNECNRHLKDRERTDIYFDVEAASRAIKFIEQKCCLKAGKFDGEPFTLLPWQAFIVGSLVGWYRTNTKSRRFREAMIVTSKGSGKSPLAAAIGLYYLVFDGQEGALTLFAAPTFTQSMIGFTAFTTMIRYSPELSAAIMLYGGPDRETSAYYTRRSSTALPISSDSNRKSGHKPTCIICDEVHEMADFGYLDMLRLGFKNTLNPLMLLITNAAADRTGPAFAYTQKAIDVAAGTKTDDEMFTYICANDAEQTKLDPVSKQLITIPQDDPFNDESCWIKTNPSLPVIPGYDYIRSEVNRSKGFPVSEANCRRLLFCEYTNAKTHWCGVDVWMDRVIKRDVWDKINMDDYPCYLGIDLSWTRDLTSIVAVWKAPEDIYYARSYFWIPGDNIRHKETQDNVPYNLWIKEGHVFAPKGSIIDRQAIVRFLKTDLMMNNDVKGLAFDPSGIMEFRGALADNGIDTHIHGSDEPQNGLKLVKHWQGERGMFNDDTLSMPRGINKLEELIFKKQLIVLDNPCLHWNSLCAVLDVRPTGNRLWDKRQSRGRIDGVVALTEAVNYSCWLDDIPDSKTIWERDELFDEDDRLLESI